MFSKSFTQIIETYVSPVLRQESFLISFLRDLTDFARRVLLITAFKAVWLQAVGLPMATVARRATNK